MTRALITTLNGDPSLVLVESIPLDRNPAAVYLGGLAPSGRRTQRRALDAIAGLITGNPDSLACNWAALRYQHMAAIRARLAESYKPATVNKMLSALRGVLRAAWRLGLMAAEDYQTSRDVEGVKGETLPAGRELTPGEILALVQVCEADSLPQGIRDAAMIGILYAGGLRREELIGLDLGDYDAESGRLVVRGKRHKERAVFIAGGAARALADWLKIRGYDPGPLFWPIDKGGNLRPRGMGAQAVYDMLQRRAGEAGVKHFSPHDLRRTFVSDLLDKGADIATVQKMAGHANVTTTARYDRRPEEAKRKAAGLLHLPYRGRL